MSEEEKKKAAQEAYLDTPEGEEAAKKAREKYDNTHPEKRRLQKRDYMRRKRRDDPTYGND
tara:strand:- start:12797 stop:12979 length:183 start_codon:yes stop_codon:yes gene_type:complete